MDDSGTELLDGDSYGLAGKIRIHSEGKEFASLLSQIDTIRNYLEENLISMLIQSVLNCSYYVFARPRFDTDYDCLRGETEAGGKEWKDYHIYGYHDLQAIQVALSGKDRMANMYSRCSISGMGELTTFSMLASPLTKHLNIASTNHFPKLAKPKKFASSKYLKHSNIHAAHWSPKSEAIIQKIFISAPNLVKLEMVKVTNSVLEMISKHLGNLKYLTIDLDNPNENERGLLSICGKRIDTTIYPLDEEIESQIIENENTSIGPWLVVDEFVTRIGRVSRALDKKMFNFQVSPLDVPPCDEMVERLSSLLTTGSGCLKLETIKIKGDTDLAFFKPSNCDPLVQNQKTYVGCSIAAFMLFLPNLKKLEVSYISKIFHETLKQVQVYKDSSNLHSCNNSSLDIKLGGEMTLCDIENAYGAFPECENLFCNGYFSPLFLDQHGNNQNHPWDEYVTKISQFKHLRMLTVNDTLSTKVFIKLIDGLKETRNLEKLKLQVNLNRSGEPDQKFTPEVALKIVRNLPQLRSLFLVLSDFFDLENFTNAFINPADSVKLSENNIRECRAKFEDFMRAQDVEDVDFKLEELGINYSDLTENKFNFDLFGAFLSRASNLKRLMFTTQFGFKDGWLVPIISAINNWRAMEIIHLNTSQAFDSDYEIVNDSDTEFDNEAEKRPTEHSLDFLVNQIITGNAKNLKFLRGDWKVAERKYDEVKADLTKSGILPKLVMKVEGVVETQPKITVPRPGKRHEPNFLEKFPYLLSAKSYRYELTNEFQDDFYMSTFTGQNGPFYESESDSGSYLD
eukprot:TRINITY_DN16388_c0_g1_i1.p1 TRINITY_DN16388_c0_g1~~TRINITY_DN16388_c0_g1_i1.p1  ORF type:complete len:809 (-),score=191.03 TRINITY_DN16388_c0_g1_i1:67-2454(-)